MDFTQVLKSFLNKLKEKNQISGLSGTIQHPWVGEESGVREAETTMLRDASKVRITE